MWKATTKLWNGLVQTRVCHSGPLTSRGHYPTSYPDQFNPGKPTTLGPAYSSGYNNHLWTTNYYLFSWCSLLKPSKVSRSQDLWLLNMEQKVSPELWTSSRTSCNPWNAWTGSKVVSFHWVHPGDRLYHDIPLFLTVPLSAWQQGTLAPEMSFWLLLLTSVPNFAVPPQELSFWESSLLPISPSSEVMNCCW